MDTHLSKKFTDVLCTVVYSESLEFVLRRKIPMTSELEIVIVDRVSMTVRNTINCMQFEGVSKDDINYHMLVYYKPSKVQNSRMNAADPGAGDGGFEAPLDGAGPSAAKN